MNIAIAQLNTRAGDFSATADRIVDTSLMALKQGADLLVMPMTALTGPLPVDHPDREGYAIDLAATLSDIAQRIVCPCLVPVVSEADNEAYHEVMLLQEGEAIPLRMRAYVNDSEQRRGSDDLVDVTTFELGGLTFGLALTYEDLNDLIDEDARPDVVLFLSDYAYALDDASSAMGSALTEARFKSDAVALDAWLVGVGSLGGYGLQVYTGSSFVMSPRGELVASAPAFEEALLVAQVGERPSADGAPHAPTSLEPEIYNRSLHLWEALSLGLADYVGKQGRSDAVLVLDGSLASCLLATLASDALGPTHVHVLLQQVRGAAPTSVAQRMAETLRVHVLPMDLDGLVANGDEDLRRDVSQALLAQAARTYDAVALSGEDKTFLALEATSAACRAADLLPFGDVYRSDLVEMAHMRSTISPIIPREAFAVYTVPDISAVVEAEPTPEARLKRMDVVLANYIEWGRSLSDVAARQGNPIACEQVVRRLRQCEPARTLWPSCLVASSRPLFMARTPICFAWHDSVREDGERQRGRHASERMFLAAGAGRQMGQSVPSSIAELLQGLEVEFKPGEMSLGAGALGDNQELMEGPLGEIMGLLQDLIQGGMEQHPSIEGPFGPLTWGSPFSEN